MNDNIINECIYPEKLREFENNIGANNAANSLHNMYHIQLEDRDGNVEEYFGKNVMTNYFFRERLCGYSDNVNRNFQIYVGDGVDSEHQPNVENKSMFNVLTTSWKSVDRTRTYYPLTYHSETGYVTQDIKACKIQYDYNLSGVTENVELNEIGCGSSATNLYSHSKIYDVDGNEKTITKRPNQTLTVTLYWRISVHESFYTNLWNDGIYGTIQPADFLNLSAYLNGGKRELRVTLCKPSSTLAGYFQNDSGNSGYYLPYDLTMFYNGQNSSIIQNDDGSRTWTTSTVSDSYAYKKYLMEKNKFDFFSSIFFSDNGYQDSTYQTACNNYNMCLFKEYKMPEAETIETLVKTSSYYKTDFMDIIGRYTHNCRGNTSSWSEEYLWGYLPVVDMDIQSIKRYNFQTGEFDVDEVFNNPTNNNYDFFGFVKVGYCWIYGSSGNAMNAYICSNQDTQNRAVVGFKSTGATCWATDTWWDSSSWQLVANTSQIESELQHKKFWIFNKGINYESSSGDLDSTSSSSSRWWPCPEFEYPDGVHEITPPFERYADEVSALYYYGDTQNVSVKYADETNGFYVQNHVVIRKPESSFSFCPIDNIYEKRETLFQPLTTPYVMRTPYLGNQVFINGKVIYFIHRWYDSRSSYNIQTANGIHMVITDLSLPDNEIADSVKYVDVNNTYTHTLKSIDNYRFSVVGKYLVFTGGGEILIFDTDTDESWLCPYSDSGTFLRKICGTTSIVISPTTDDTVWRIYDCATKQVTSEFSLPEGYSYDTSKGFFAFEDWIYIKCIYGTNNVMFMYTISTQEFKQIIYPSTMDSYNYRGFVISNMTTDDYSAPVSNSSVGYTHNYRDANGLNENVHIQYKDGICVLRSTDPNSSRTVLIISRYDPENLMIQQYYYNSTNTSDDSIQLAKIYENYYLGITFRSNSHGSSYVQHTKFMDIGRIVKTGSTYSTSDDVEYKCYARDGILSGTGQASIATIYKNKIYYYGNSFSGCNVMVCPPEGIMTHKINFKTNTCQRWNNPKLITIPSFDITLTNIIDQT